MLARDWWVKEGIAYQLEKGCDQRRPDHSDIVRVYDETEVHVLPCSLASVKRNAQARGVVERLSPSKPIPIHDTFFSPFNQINNPFCRRVLQLHNDVVVHHGAHEPQELHEEPLHGGGARFFVELPKCDVHTHVLLGLASPSLADMESKVKQTIEINKRKPTIIQFLNCTMPFCFTLIELTYEDACGDNSRMKPTTLKKKLAFQSSLTSGSRDIQRRPSSNMSPVTSKQMMLFPVGGQGGCHSQPRSMRSGNVLLTSSLNGRCTRELRKLYTLFLSDAACNRVCACSEHRRASSAMAA